MIAPGKAKIHRAGDTVMTFLGVTVPLDTVLTQ